MNNRKIPIIMGFTPQWARQTKGKQTNQEACAVTGVGQGDGGNREGGWGLGRD